MKQFFKYVFASVFGVVIGGMVLFGLMFIILIGAASALESLGEDKAVTVDDNSILHIKLNNQIVDRAEEDPFSEIDFGPFQGEKKTGLNSILESLDKAKTDERIQGIYLDLSSVPAGLGTIEEIRTELLNFKESGKWVIAYSEGYSQGAYYLATTADKIYLYPQGGMDFKGLATKIMFFKKALEKMDVDVQIIRGRDNKYKSAVEPFMYDKMSESNRQQLTDLLNSAWGHMITNISDARGISVGELMVIADSLKAQNPNEAVKLGMVDATIHEDEVMNILMDKVGEDEREDLEFISLGKYAKAKVAKSDEETPSYKIKDKIAVVYAEGGINSGRGGDGSIGSVTTASAIRKAREDSSVKAIVFRVNSPGGSALASDVIWRETVLAKAEKPFIVSMGDLAASGGYYISTYADRIFAEPTTITGSIGVFGMIPNAQKFLNEQIGLTFDEVKTNENAIMMTLDAPLTEYQNEVIQESVIMIYDTFLTRVAEGRGMTVQEVDAIAQGRVWTGIAAKEIGLVDELGGLNDAIEYAAAQAELEEYKLKELPELKDPFEELMKEFSGQAYASYMEYTLGDMYPYIQQLKEISEQDGIQARMPFYLNVQ
jgi:protease-4